MDTYGKIGNNRLVKLSAKRESSSGAYLTSDSVKDCRLSASERSVIRVRGNVGVTGGYVDARPIKLTTIGAKVDGPICDYSDWSE